MNVVHDPNQLFPTDKRIIERRQFDTLPAAQQVQFDAWQTYIDSRFPQGQDMREQDVEFAAGAARSELDQFAIDTNGYQITWREMSSIINARSSGFSEAPRPAVRSPPLMRIIKRMVYGHKCDRNTFHFPC